MDMLNPDSLTLGFQFLGIPPKGELDTTVMSTTVDEIEQLVFPISRDPPEGGTALACPRDTIMGT